MIAGLFLLKDDLEFLRTMMGRTVVLCSRQEAYVVSDPPALHQSRDELIRGQAAETPVLWRHDDVEPAPGACDLAPRR